MHEELIRLYEVSDITADTIVAVLRDCVLRLNLNSSQCRGLMLMVHQNRQGTGMEWQNILPEKNQECCLPTVRCIHWIWHMDDTIKAPNS